MLETPHVIVAAAIAYKVGNPALSLPLAVGSHFILEKVPHWNPHLNTEIKKFGKLSPTTLKIIWLDVFLSLLAGFFVASRVLPNPTHFVTIIAACFLGVIPDLIEAPYFLMNKRNRFFEKLVAFQKSIQNDTTIVPGLFFQVVTASAALFWVLS